LELWKSNGTNETTILVADINPGSGGSLPNELTAVGGTLYFTAFDTEHGIELWKSDGTTEGTALVADIQPGSEGSNPRNLAFVHGALYFSADDGKNGREPWILRFTEPGTTSLIGSLKRPAQGSRQEAATNASAPGQSRPVERFIGTIDGEVRF